MLPIIILVYYLLNFNFICLPPRASLKNLLNNNPCLTGSTSVTPSKYKIKDPDPEPLPGPTASLPSPQPSS